MNDRVLTWISDAEGGHSEVLSAGGSQLDVVAIVVMDTSLGQHSVVLNLALPNNRTSSTC